METWINIPVRQPTVDVETRTGMMKAKIKLKVGNTEANKRQTCKCLKHSREEKDKGKRDKRCIRVNTLTLTDKTPVGP